MADETRERDRLAAVAARSVALRTLPVIAAVWLGVVVVVRAELALRVVTLVAILASVSVAGRAAVTARTFLQRWGDTAERRPPPQWVSLVAVAGAVAAFVAGANVAADIDASRSTARAIVVLTVFLALTGAAVYAHVAGGRGVAAALRPTWHPAGPEPAGPASLTQVEPRQTQPAPELGHAAPGMTRVELAHAGPQVTWPEPELGHARLLRDGGSADAAVLDPAGLDPAGLDSAVLDSAVLDTAGLDPALGALRELLSGCPAPPPGVATPTAEAVVARFRGGRPDEVVEAARAELDDLLARMLPERKLAQVVALLGMGCHPPDDGITYGSWLMRLSDALAEG